MKFRLFVFVLLLFLITPMGVLAKGPEVEPNDTMATATNCVLGEDLWGNATGLNDVDYFKLNLEAGQQINITFKHQGSYFAGVSDFYLQLRNSSGSVVAQSSTAAGSTTDWEAILYTATYTGAYYIRTDLWVWYSTANTYNIWTSWENEPTPTPTASPTPTVTPTPTTPPSGIDYPSWESYK